MTKIDLLQEMRTLRTENAVSEEILMQAKQILADKVVSERLRDIFPNGKTEEIFNAIRIECQYELENELQADTTLYSESEIQAICKKYRLKCLPARLYKNDVPRECGEAIIKFEEEHKTKHRIEYYILAPKNHFIKPPKQVKDPIVFAQIGYETNFRYVYKWGDDFTPVRRLAGILQSSISSFFRLISIWLLLMMVTSIVVSFVVMSFSPTLFALIVGLVLLVSYMLVNTKLGDDYTEGWSSSSLD
jgi:hypothetical protein